MAESMITQGLTKAGIGNKIDQLALLNILTSNAVYRG